MAPKPSQLNRCLIGRTAPVKRITERAFAIAATTVSLPNPLSFHHLLGHVHRFAAVGR